MKGCAFLNKSKDCYIHDNNNDINNIIDNNAEINDLTQFDVSWNIIYTMTKHGQLIMDVNVDTSKIITPIPRVGIQLQLDPTFQSIVSIIINYLLYFVSFYLICS
jgi:hypothetical protein